MILQLSNGKCFYLTTEQYLSLSDQDIKDITACGIGSYHSDPFKGSIIKQDKKKKEDIIYEEIDESIDYNEESDEIEITVRREYITIDEIEDIIDYDDDDE